MCIRDRVYYANPQSAPVPFKVVHDTIYIYSNEPVSYTHLPNMFAIGLAAKKHYHIVCIIPYYIEQDYWYAVAEGIDRAAQELRPFNVGVSYLYYRHADKSSYRCV